VRPRCAHRSEHLVLVKGKFMSLCVLRAFGALCAEHGPEGVAFCKASNPTPLWTTLDPQKLAPSGCPKRTVQCFKVLFPDDDLPHDKGGNRTQTSGVMLHRRSQAVKELIIKGPSAVELHRKLSWHAMHSLHATDGVVACHTAHGPCAACQAYCPLLYAALQPRKKGRPAGKGMSCSAMRQLFSSVFCTRCHMSMSYVMLVVKSDTKTLEHNKITAF
jgi:hypothetical protein